MPSLPCGSFLRSKDEVFSPRTAAKLSYAQQRRHRYHLPSSSSSSSAPAPKRILMLGIGGAGKSTLFRQIQHRSWTSRDLLQMKGVIHGLVVVAIKALVDSARRDGRMNGVDAAVARSADFVQMALRYDDAVTSKAGRHIGRLWQDRAIQVTFELRFESGISVPDSVKYFLDRIALISDPAYVPSASDYLHCTVRSSGISEAQSLIGGRPFQFLDLGGRRAERKKWIKTVDNLAAIVFVVSVGDFADPLEEDPTSTRTKEALMVFEELVNHETCSGIPIIVTFTKVDLLAKALRRSRLENIFPAYSGGSDPLKAMAFFKSLFLSKVSHIHPSRQVTVLTCNALDRGSAATAIKTIRDVIHHANTVRVKSP